MTWLILGTCAALVLILASRAVSEALQWITAVILALFIVWWMPRNVRKAILDAWEREQHTKDDQQAAVTYVEDYLRSKRKT